MNRRHDDPEMELAQALMATLALIAILAVVGHIEAPVQQQIEEAAAEPAKHGAVWNEAAGTWDYAEAASYEF